MHKNPSRIGSLIFMVKRSLYQHALSTWITILSVALAAGLLMSIFVIQKQSRLAFTGGPIGFDAVLGARGSQLQLVLNTVFHLETSPGNIPWNLYLAMKKHSMVKLAIPYAVGDNYQNFRIVGTSDEIFTKFEYQKGKKFLPQKGGRFFNSLRREAVIGSFVAQKTGLKVGSTFNPYHGFIYDDNMKHMEEYVVVGILETTNSPSDRVIWIPIEGIFRMGGHVLRGSGEKYKAEAGQEIPDEHKEVSAVMIKLRSIESGFFLEQMVNKQGKVATLAWPIDRTIADFFEKLGWLNHVLELIAYLVAFVAAGSILASIYNTMNERKREFAILRALGAKRQTLFAAIISEAATIALLGSLTGYLVFLAILSATAFIIQEQTGVVLQVFLFHPVFVWVPIGMITLGAFSGVIPAFKAYQTDIASNLIPIS